MKAEPIRQRRTHRFGRIAFGRRRLVTIACFILLALGLIAGYLKLPESNLRQVKSIMESVAPATMRPPVADLTPYVAASGRSPIPQPGESILTPLPVRYLAKPRPAVVVSASGIGAVPWHDAHRYSGKTIAVEGQIVTTHRTASVCFLNFSRQWKDKFYVVIFSEALNGWSQPPEQYFLNKRIVVTGKIDAHKNRPQIRVTDPRQIMLLAD